MYSVYDLKTSQLLGCMSWDNVRAIYAGDDTRYVAVYLSRKGQFRVKWITSNLEATRSESQDVIRLIPAESLPSRITMQTF